MVETGNPDAGSLQREIHELMAKALRGELEYRGALQLGGRIQPNGRQKNRPG